MIITTSAGESNQPQVGAPAHPEGEGRQWKYVVVAMNGVTYFSDTATEIIEATLEGYKELRHEDRNGEPEFFDVGDDLALIARYDDLVRYSTALQESILATAIERDGFDPASVSEEVLTTLIAERIVPFEGIPLSDQPGDQRVDLEWNQPVPLVLIASDYLPFTERQVPTGNIIWLDPTTELTYLRSLNSVGVLSMLTGDGQ